MTAEVREMIIVFWVAAYVGLRLGSMTVGLAVGRRRLPEVVREALLVAAGLDLEEVDDD